MISGFVARACGGGNVGYMGSGGHTSCCSWKDRTAGRSGGPDGGVLSPAALPLMISVSANQSSREILKGCPKFGPFFETEI